MGNDLPLMLEKKPPWSDKMLFLKEWTSLKEIFSIMNNDQISYGFNVVYTIY